MKLGNLDISAFKVGSGDCSIYLGTTLVYSGGTPTPTLQWVEFNSGDSIVGLDIYGVSGASTELASTFSPSSNDEPFNFEYSRNKVECWVRDNGQYYGQLCYNNVYLNTDTIELVFSNIGCNDYYTWESSYLVHQAESTFKLLIYQ